MISRMLSRRIFIAVNNPWICDINQDPVKICHDMDYILQEQPLAGRLALRTDFKVEDRYGLFPMYRIYVSLEAIGTTTAITLGTVYRADVKDMDLILSVQSKDNVFKIHLPTDCEDLDSAKFELKKNEFETRNVMAYETDSKIR